MGEHVPSGASFDDLAVMHHEHFIGDLIDHGEVVRNEQECSVGFFRQSKDEIEDLALHGDIECTRRLIGDEETRVAGKRNGDADTLALPSRQLMWVGVGDALR